MLILQTLHLARNHFFSYDAIKDLLQNNSPAHKTALFGQGLILQEVFNTFIPSEAKEILYFL